MSDDKLTFLTPEPETSEDKIAETACADGACALPSIPPSDTPATSTDHLC